MEANRGAQGEGSHLSFDGLRVVSFESRRKTEIAELVRRHGGEPVSAPAIREVPLDDNQAALEFARELRSNRIDVAIFLTGVGARLLFESIAGEMPREEIAAALARTATVVRGPKPRAALRELGVTPTISVEEPNTWREILAAVDARLDVRGRRIAVQEYGDSNPELLTGLASRGATILRVPVYRWTLPDDVAPLREAIERIVTGEIELALFTSATQVDHLFAAAGERETELRDALGRMVVASIGPICSEALRRRGIAVDIEPEHPKMGHLVLAIAARARSLLAVKRA